jgi:hypothetical protein
LAFVPEAGRGVGCVLRSPPSRTLAARTRAAQTIRPFRLGLSGTTNGRSAVDLHQRLHVLEEVELLVRGGKPRSRPGRPSGTPSPARPRR